MPRPHRDSLLLFGFAAFFAGCGGGLGLVEARASAIPDDAVKVTPQTDPHPPVLDLEGWSDPVPMPGPVNTAGAEDSPFVTPDAGRFFFFFTPDAAVPAEDQLNDGATGIWWTEPAGDSWAEPRRAVLFDDVALDGCPFVTGDTLWFCSVRADNYGDVDLWTAAVQGGQKGELSFSGWENAGRQLNRDYDVGEMHIQGDTMYMHAERSEGAGGLDLYTLASSGSGWDEPETIGSPIDTSADELLPFVSSDGRELWYTSFSSTLGLPGPAIFRALLQEGGTWGTPEEVVSSYAAEPTLDDAGNLYFVHHFYPSGSGGMIEADIYVAWRRN
jgi:hypothetical protein